MSFAIVNEVSGQGIVFDSHTERWSRSVNATEHPIEDGVSVTDHLQRQPDMCTVTATVSATPLAGTGALQSGTDRLLHYDAFLHDAQGQSVTLFFERETRENWAILGVSNPVDVLEATTYVLVLRELQIGNVAVVQIPPEAPAPTISPGISDPQDLGVQPTQPSNRNQSTAFTLARAIGVL